MPAISYSKVNSDVDPLPNDILIVDLEKGARRTIGGIILTDDNGKLRGIHPRWAKVYKVGSKVDYVSPGEYILLQHGHWTYGIDINFTKEDGEQEHYLHKADPNGILLIKETEPSAYDIQKGKD